jgi:uncharacterized glyoxalase superfamily protein PhnB
MAEQTSVERLDQAVDTLLARGGGTPPRADVSLGSLGPLLRVAADLVDLPREEFRAHLRRELERRIPMPTASRPIRADFNTITPYLVVDQPVRFLEFLNRAFGAQEVMRTTGTKGGLHAELRIGDSMVMAGGGEGILPVPAAIHLYVGDADMVYRRALEAGGTAVREPSDQPYGDREATVVDPSGNHWYIATHRATGHAPEGLRSITPYLHPRGAETLVDFLERAFGAEEAFSQRASDGTILHAKLRIGDSIVELAEARGSIEPMPCTLLLYVNAVDAAYDRALAAGATAIEPPAEQPYGERRAGVRDPHGNVWYVSAPTRV